MDTDGLTAIEIADAVRTGRLTAREATEQALARIAERNGPIGAFQEVRVLAALREADAVDALPDKRSLALAGVPVAIKDNVPVAGDPMREGTDATSDEPQTTDHPIVTRLREAGAVVVGITRVPELCLFAVCDSEFGVTRNPWNHASTPGGSSGGSAAAVAAGMVPLAHGNDGMGSIRIPAACCGLVGIKPGSGVVPAELGGDSWFGLSENGPLASTVADTALGLSVMAGDPALAALGSPGTQRVAVSAEVPMMFAKLDKHWADVALQTADLLRSLGHDVEREDPPYNPTLVNTETYFWTAGAAATIGELVEPHRALRRTRAHARVGRVVRAFGGPRQSARDKWRRRADRFFERFDVLVTPTLATDPIRADGWASRGWLSNVWANSHYAPYAGPWNIAGWPAIAVPAGVGPKGLPLSVQLVAPPGSETLLLSLAAQLETARPWQRTAPR